MLLAELEARGGEDGLKAFVEEGAQIWGGSEGVDAVTFRGGSSDYFPAMANDGNAARALADAKKRLIWLCEHHRPVVNDRLRLPPKSGDSGDEAAMTVLAPSVLPDAVFLVGIAQKRRGQPAVAAGHRGRGVAGLRSRVAAAFGQFRTEAR